MLGAPILCYVSKKMQHLFAKNLCPSVLLLQICLRNFVRNGTCSTFFTLLPAQLNCSSIRRAELLLRVDQPTKRCSAKRCANRFRSRHEMRHRDCRGADELLWFDLIDVAGAAAGVTGKGDRLLRCTARGRVGRDARACIDRSDSAWRHGCTGALFLFGCRWRGRCPGWCRQRRRCCRRLRGRQIEGAFESASACNDCRG